MRTRRVVAIVLIGLIAVGGCSGAARATSSESTPPGDNSSSLHAITTQATGQVKGVPDVLNVWFNVHTEGTSANDTLRDNSAATQQVIDAAHGAGVSDDDIQTTNIAISPRFDTPTGRAARVVGYSADNSFVVKLRDPAKNGATIDALSAAAGDAVQVQGIAYSFDDDTKLLDEARKDAVARARAQAQQLADAAGVQLGAVRSVTDAPAQPPSYPYALGAGAAAARDAVAVPVSPGTQQLTLTVTVVFDIA